jgi:catechol 2,3-dioxygenase-like lactoylglutathione lyase family enzyme
MNVGVSEVALFTADVEATRRFYETLLDMAPEAEWPEGVLFDARGVKLLLHARMAAPDAGRPNEDHGAFSVADLDGACALLSAAGHELLVAPREFPWGRSAYLRDPDGRLVELAQG